MSIGDPLHQLHDLGRRFIRQFVQLPAEHLLGISRASTGRPPGSMPGALFVDPQATPTRIRAVCIHDDRYETTEVTDPGQLREMKQHCKKLWLDVTGFGDEERLRQVGEAFGLHPLTLADLVNREHQTRTDSTDAMVWLVTEAPRLAHDPEAAGLESFGLVMGDGWVLTFREQPGTLFEPIMHRLQRPDSRLSTDPVDYLAYALLDITIDSFFPVIEALASRIDESEDEVLDGRGAEVLSDIHAQRRALIALGRLCWRQRDLIARLLRDDHFRPEISIFLQDVHDRTVQLQDMVEGTRELAGSLVELHLSISSQRSGQVVETLTLMASIFIPLTLVAGIYGMNFEHMPELDWYWGYPMALATMGVLGVGLYFWFRRKVRR